jgi:hypothetical protein
MFQEMARLLCLKRKSMNKYILIFLTILISSCSTGHFPYFRNEWQYGKDEKLNCIDTRGEILITRSSIPVVMNKSKCTVKLGKWADYYYPEVYTSASLVEIDHLVPLKNANDNGGYSWSQQKKMEFANDPENLVITKKSYNRIKGASGIDRWLPVNISYACKYVSDWIKIKKKYSLKLSGPERKTIASFKDRCQGDLI